MAVNPSRASGNGFIEYGFAEGCEHVLQELLRRCATLHSGKGETKLVKFVFTKFGQVRNREITLWESLGFASDEYGSVACQLPLSESNVPPHFDPSLIEPVTAIGTEEIKSILLEDGEDETADLFGHQYLPGTSPDQVILALRDVLPESLIKEIQKYAKGKHLYIPQTERQTWGTSTGIKDELEQRNAEIVRRYHGGASIARLAAQFL